MLDTSRSACTSSLDDALTRSLLEQVGAGALLYAFALPAICFILWPMVLPQYLVPWATVLALAAIARTAISAWAARKARDSVEGRKLRAITNGGADRQLYYMGRSLRLSPRYSFSVLSNVRWGHARGCCRRDGSINYIGTDHCSCLRRFDPAPAYRRIGFCQPDVAYVRAFYRGLGGHSFCACEAAA